MKKKIAVFASGSGSNTIKIVDHFQDKSFADVTLLVSNKKTAGILSNPSVSSISKLIVNRQEFYEETYLLTSLIDHQIDLIVLAGFLWKIPSYLIQGFPNKIINIHPALLPNYGGKGMYGMNVHRAVFKNGDKKSGMTIHYVNEHYDEGAIIFQSQCSVSDVKTPEEIARRVLVLEHQYYSHIVEMELLK